jgi:acetyl-CoA C-acetyltransferase
MFAELAMGYFTKYNIDPMEGKKLIAQIAVKNHHNGSLHPKAHYQREITLEQVMNAPIVAWPLGLFDCCGVSDGAAAAVVTRTDLAKNFRDDPIYIKSLAICTGGRQKSLMQDYDFSYVPENLNGSKAAYAEAGITDPRKELSMAEVHDCFSIHEMVIYEDFGFSARGRARYDIEAGTFTLKGELPVNTDGGLKCFGHPLGASGLRMAYEVYKQLQGKAGPRQIKNPKLGLTHNIGGAEGMPSCAISILGNSQG